MRNDVINSFFLKNKKIKTYNNIFGNPNQYFINLPKTKKILFKKNITYIDNNCRDSLKNKNIFFIFRENERKLYIIMQNSNLFKKMVLKNLNIDWSLRELYEFFGIKSINLVDNRNLLLDYGFQDNPLLKTYNCMGYKELFYDFFLEKPVYKKVNHVIL